MNKKVALYVRVSTLEQAESGYSIGEQIDKLRKYADIKEWHVYDVYEDGGFSGSNTTRPALERLISDAKRHTFDTVLVYKLDRLSRSQKDTLFLIEDIFKANEVDLVSLNENFDTSTAFGTAMIGILSVFAQLEREQIKERMKLGKIGRARSGKAMGWHVTPFGYLYDKQTGNFVVDDLAAGVVKMIFSDYLNGMSITKLRDKLNIAGHIGKDREWSYRTLRQTLDNPTYTGLVKYDGQVFEGNHEAIIDKKTFDAVQSELDIRQKKAYAFNNNPRPFQSKYMLSGIIRCGYCGAPLVSTLGNVRKDGTRLMKYQCTKRIIKKTRPTTVYNDNKKCDSGFYMMQNVESYVVNAISELQASPELVESMMQSTTEKPKTNIKQLESELAKISSRLKKLSDLYLNDLISIDDLKKQTTDLKENRKRIEDTIDNNKDDNDEKVGVLKSKLTGSDIKERDYQDQSNLVKAFVRKVSVTSDNIEISWNF